MMKKLKGVAGASESLPYGVYEEAKTRIKHQSLIQEYQELHKENEAMRNKLQTTKQKKLTLLAEVRYLRHKFECLVQNQTNRQQLYAQTQRQPQKTQVQSKNVIRGKSYTGKDTGFHSRFTNVDYNNKNRINNGKEAAPRPPVPRFQFSPNNTSFSRNVSPMRNHMPNFESRQKGRIYSGKEAVLRNQTPVLDLSKVAIRNPVRVFDLNQISGEEDEFQAYSVPVKLDEPKNCSINGVMGEQQNEMKLSACRNLENDTKRVGKRKISWQDQVALRV